MRPLSRRVDLTAPQPTPLEHQKEHDWERGAALILVMVTLLVLIAFAALAVDSAMAWSQRRQNQGAVDLAAIAGAQMTVGVDQATAITDAQAEVIRISYISIAPAMTPGEWNSIWLACTDGSRPASYTLTGTSDCVSFTADMSQIRVQLPEVAVDTAFAAVIGANQVVTGATAEVLIAAAGTVSGIGSVVPFGLPAAAAGNSEICLKTGSQPSTGVCSGPASGNFGYLDFTRWGFGGFTPPTTTDCGFNPAPKVVAQNIAHGVDHLLGLGANIGDLTLDADVCNGAPGPVTGTQTSTGNMAKTIEDGFISGDGGWAGRLTQIGSGAQFQTRSIHSTTVDDTPLWAFLHPQAGTINGACAGISTKADMLACLNAWTPGDAASLPAGEALFVDALADSARMVWVPMLWDTNWPNGKKDVTFREFRPVYVQTLLADCKISGCKDEWDPGEGSAIGTKDFKGLTGLQFDTIQLPQVVLDMQPGNPSNSTPTFEIIN